MKKSLIRSSPNPIIGFLHNNHKIRKILADDCPLVARRASEQYK